jgi:hypothetical protein
MSLPGKNYAVLWIIGFVLFVHLPISNAQIAVLAVKVDTQIVAGRSGSDYSVGNAFHYNITLTNIGNRTVNSNFTVSVYNPSRELLGTRVFTRNLLPGKVTFLFPSKQNPMIPSRSEYDVFSFDSAGSYKLVIVSSQSLFFFRQWETEYTYSENSFTFYFDAMPKWEKDWRDTLTQWQITNENLSEQMLTLNKLFYRLTYVVGFLTVANLGITAWTARKRIGDAVLVTILASILFLLAMQYLEIPWL